MEYSTGESGIKSLGGFAYQIKVFVYYLSKLQQNEQMEFETLEDVNIKAVQKDEIDTKSDSYKCIIKEQETNVAIQVKRTSITNASAEKILYNWLLVEKTHDNISKYLLFTDKAYDNQDIIFNRDYKKLFEKIKSSDKKANALITMVKNIFNDDFEEFEVLYKRIQDKYEFKVVDEIDNQILNTYERIFHRSAPSVSEIIYYMRIQELMRYVTMKIMQSVNKGQPFICTYSEFMQQIEEICKNIEENQVILSYSMFKSNNAIDWEDLKIINSRECIQLNSCNLSRQSVEQHLMYKLYYEFLKCSYMENNKIPRIEDMENTTYENYDFLKSVLQQENRDTPLNRLNDIKKSSNSYTPNEQVKYGVAIHLTRDDIDDEKQISWKEDI